MYNVVEKQTAVNVHDSTIYVGDAWTAQNNFDSALDKDGNVLDYANFIAAGGAVDDSRVDPNTPGTYDVTYTLDGITSTAKDKDSLTVPVSSSDKTNTENIKASEVAQDNDNQLPQTGENQKEEGLAVVLGMLILILISIVIFFKKKN